MARTKQTARKITVVKLPESNWQRRQQERALPQLVVWKNLTDTDQEQSLCEKSDDIRSQLSCWSEICLSSDLSVKSLRFLRLICDSRAQQSWPCRKPVRATWSACSKKPFCARSMPSDLQSYLKTSNLRDESVVNELKFVLTAEAKKAIQTRPIWRPPKIISFIVSITCIVAKYFVHFCSIFFSPNARAFY